MSLILVNIRKAFFREKRPMDQVPAAPHGSTGPMATLHLGAEKSGKPVEYLIVCRAGIILLQRDRSGLPLVIFKDLNLFPREVGVPHVQVRFVIQSERPGIEIGRANGYPQVVYDQSF